mmetsp:Transcript_11053/g.47204  ORF Transcript_11053/g.47204 Transcript_11053/m.47204 type:complete len:423 (+) Transcript_11053:547-1815(+)
MRSMSSFDKRPLSLVMVILFFWPVDLSSAETFRMPLASMSKHTLIWGTPRGAGGMPCSSNLPSRLLSLVRLRSPSNTWISTPGWLSEYVENTCSFLVGMVVLRGMSTVMTPPTVSRPMDRGDTSSRSRSWTFSLPSPDRIAACTAAPYATASSGCTDLFKTLPSKYSDKSVWTRGTRVEPPTSTISSTSVFFILASSKTRLTDSRHRKNRGSQTFSNLARVYGMLISWSPMNASMVAPVEEDNMRFARSHAVRSLRCALSSPVKMSSPDFFKCCAATSSASFVSKSSPPRCVSPLVETTSNTPLSMVRMETSKVPPPRSKTRMFFSPFLSRPYAIAAAVGSLMMRATFKPEMVPASLVAWRCASLKYAGTVITALVTVSPRYEAASSQSLRRTCAEISSAAKSLPAALHSSFTLPVSPFFAV